MPIEIVESEVKTRIEATNSTRSTTNAELQRNIKAFEAMFEELNRDHADEHVIFHDGEFAGAYPSFHQAAESAVQQFGVGPFLIRKVGDRHVMPMPASVAYRTIHANS